MRAVLLAFSLAIGAGDKDGAAARAGEGAKLQHEEGMRHLERRNYDAAARAFRDALVTNPDRAQSHYQLANALARLREAGKACEHDATLDEILDHLERAQELGPDRVQRMKKDRDLESVRRSFRFQRLLGRTPKNDGDIRHMLTGPDWRGAGKDGIDFHDDGTLDHWTSAAGTGKRTARPGHWHAESGVVTITFDETDGAFTSLRLLFGDDGVLEGDGLRFTEAGDECP